MSLSSLSVRRPVLATVMAITIIIFGVIGYTFLGVREYPSVDPPIITVSTSYVGASADVIESQITEPLEESINGIAGIRTLTSTSRDGRSTIRVEFNIDVDLQDAANDVRDRVSRAQRNLPPDTDPPIVTKSDADAIPIVFLNIKSEQRDLLELSDIAQRTFKERVQTIEGVSEVWIWGEKQYSMRLWLDPVKMAAFRITPIDVRNALQKENIELPTGRIEGVNTELTIRTLGRLTSVNDFNNLIIKEDNGTLVKLKDIGDAQLYPANDRTLLKRDNVPMVGIVLVPQPGANQIQIVDEFYKRVDQIKKDLPPDIELGVGFDVTDYIRSSISEVEQTIILAFGLVILVIFLFLRDWRTTLIPILVIPISLIGSFFIMYIADFSINVLTLLGLVLAIGIVVDDAIVVLENIYKKIEAGMTPIQAALKGTKEIFFAVVSTTVALASVFLPIMFLEGLTGRLFREFGIVLAGSVIISSFVALTFTPMLSSKLLKKRSRHNKFYEMTEPFFSSMERSYRSILSTFMSRRWLAFLIIVVSAVMIYFFGSTLQTELAPMEDRGGLRISSTAPEGSTFNYMEKYMTAMVGAVMDSVEETEAVISITSPGFGASSSVNSGFVRVILSDADEREKSQQQIADEVSDIVDNFNNARTFVIQDQSIGTSRGGLPIQYVLQAPNLDKLKEVIPKFMDEARNDPTFRVIDVNLKFNKPELVLRINREKARELGIAVLDIAQTVQLAFSEQRFGFFIRDGKQYQVIGQVYKNDRNQPLDLRKLYVRNNDGDLIQLDQVVTLTEESTPPQLFRFNRYVSATVSASLAPGKTMGDGIAAMNNISDRVLDETFSTALEGPSKDFVESSSSLQYVFILALIFIYLILAAQFESFRDPFIIMFTVPLAIAGALFSLWYFNQTINIFSQIGQIMLIGLVTKNGILIVEFANQKKAQGLSILEAVQEASVLRFRPILMTSFSTVLGTLPIALALGAGSASRMPMGIAVIGGLIFATILTLFVIPAVYSLFTDKGKKSAELVEEELAREEAEVLN